MFYAFREREDIQHMMEAATGGRLHFTYNQVGGVKIDLPKGFLRTSAELTTITRSRLPGLPRPDPRQRDLPGSYEGRGGRCRPRSRCRSG
jgi:hypothetical protein